MHVSYSLYLSQLHHPVNAMCAMLSAADEHNPAETLRNMDKTNKKGLIVRPSMVFSSCYDRQDVQHVMNMKKNYSDSCIHFCNIAIILLAWSLLDILNFDF